MSTHSPTSAPTEAITKQVAFPYEGTVRAAVSTPSGKTTVHKVTPVTSEDTQGWLKVESSALCGTDVDLYQKGLQDNTVLGHHVVGKIVALSQAMQWTWNIEVGDRVALEEYLPCGKLSCPACSRKDEYRFCPEADLWGGQQRVGMLGFHEGSGLHGGNAEYFEITGRTVLHKLPESMSPDLAAWTQPFANAVDWVANLGGATEGSRVAVIGPGYHGIAAVAAARALRAKEILLVGRDSSTSRERLKIGKTLGAKTVISDSDTPLSKILGNHAKGDGFDVIIDTVGIGDQVIQSVPYLRKLGRIVLAGLGTTSEVKVNLKTLVRHAAAIVGVRGRSPQAVATSIQLLAEGKTGLEQVPSVHVKLEEVDEVFQKIINGNAPTSPHVVIRP